MQLNIPKPFYPQLPSIEEEYFDSSIFQRCWHCSMVWVCIKLWIWSLLIEMCGCCNGLFVSTNIWENDPWRLRSGPLSLASNPLTWFRVDFSMSKRRVSYFYDGINLWALPQILMNQNTVLLGDTGNYSYGLGHPMKPHRMRMAHTLVSAYKMLEKMDVVVSLFIPHNLRIWPNFKPGASNPRLATTNDQISHRRICRLPSQSNSRD